MTNWHITILSANHGWQSEMETTMSIKLTIQIRFFRWKVMISIGR